MNLIVEQLRDDHRQLVRVLCRLDHELKVLSGLEIGSSSVEKILDILDYIQVYPEIWHHPTEDVIYEVLLSKSIPDPQQLANCIEEHGILELLTENLHNYLDRLAMGDSKVRARLSKAGSDYVSRQLAHIEHEQSTVFPLMENHLAAEDWEIIKERVKAKQPLWDESRFKRYRSLYRDGVDASLVTTH